MPGKPSKRANFRICATSGGVMRTALVAVPERSSAIASHVDKAPYSAGDGKDATQKPAMQKDKDEARTASSGKASRQDRLKVALRENLKRRKAQARERDGASAASSASGKASLDDRTSLDEVDGEGPR